MAMSGLVAGFRRGMAWWLFAALGAVCGGSAFARLGVVVGRKDWFPPLDAGDQRTFVALTALTGVLVGALTGLLLRAVTMRGLPLAGRMAAWGALGAWIVVLFFSIGCFKDPPGIGGPVIYARDIGGFWDRLSGAVLLPLLLGAWIFAALGALVGAGAAAGWWLLAALIRRISARH